MPKRQDINTILVIGAGPIVIGQACEFDYAGAQACKTLKEEGYRIVLVNSNPATIMTDPELADMTYIEPITWEVVEKIIDKERPQALLPTMGGQTALNCALDLDKKGVLKKYNVEMIGATKESIDKAENRELFKIAMQNIGLECARSGLAHSPEEAKRIQADIGFPVIVRPSFTLGGTGGGIAYHIDEFIDICTTGLDASPTNELLIEESLLGWKEYEMEVVRDQKDNCIIVCSIENFDPVGIHTGDAITVAPSQTLTDKEYQLMRDASLSVLREIGVDTGGSNVQFAVNPQNGRMVVIEMNPRVSRSSALASKATGFPIAKVAARLSVGYTLDELSNDITGGQIPASFEPTLDYVVTKIPRFAFEKFPHADNRLTTQMKSVGEVMAIGRTFQESLQKAIRGLENSEYGFELIPGLEKEEIAHELSNPSSKRLQYIGEAFRSGFSFEEVQQLTNIDPWFLSEIKELIDIESMVGKISLEMVSTRELRMLKQRGFSDRKLAQLFSSSETLVRQHRRQLNVRPVYKRIDTCAAEFEASTAYMYSTYEEECEAQPTTHKKVVVLGGGPNRIGQGIEFDYCCVQAAQALREKNFEVIMVNCNPETVSTDYDTSDRLYFEPLSLEDILEIIDLEKPQGVIVQFGGQTPLKRARSLAKLGVPVIGTSPDMIDAAEDREKFQKLLQKLELEQPPNATARNQDEAIREAEKLSYPLVVRPSYVLGGRAMEIVHDSKELERYMTEAIGVSNKSPVLLDRFVNDAIEVDVDAVSDGKTTVIGGIMEHIEQAGVHSGDSACCLPPFSLSDHIQNELRRQTHLLAKELKVVGLLNIQFAVKKSPDSDIAKIYVLEVNPRAARTIPFVSKATGRPLAKIAACCMVGKTLPSQNITQEVNPSLYFVKESVFPFSKFRGADTVLGPEMKSTGEVMGIGKTFGEAYIKAQIGAGVRLPSSGNILLSVKDADKLKLLLLARQLLSLGFSIFATAGTADCLEDINIPVKRVNKMNEGRPHIVDIIKNQEVNLIVNTGTEKKTAIADSRLIRTSALQQKIPLFTTIEGALAACTGLKHQKISLYPLQNMTH